MNIPATASTAALMIPFPLDWERDFDAPVLRPELAELFLEEVFGAELARTLEADLPPDRDLDALDFAPDLDAEADRDELDEREAVLFFADEGLLRLAPPEDFADEVLDPDFAPALEARDALAPDFADLDDPAFDVLALEDADLDAPDLDDPDLDFEEPERDDPDLEDLDEPDFDDEVLAFEPDDFFVVGIFCFLRYMYRLSFRLCTRAFLQTPCRQTKRNRSATYSSESRFEIMRLSAIR